LELQPGIVTPCPGAAPADLVAAVVGGAPEAAGDAHLCARMRVTCPGLAPFDGDLALAPPLGPPRGVLALVAGGAGTTWWSSHGDFAWTVLRGLRAEGFALVQWRWDDSWLNRTLGPVGVPATACRPATVLQWAHDNVAAPLGVVHPGLPGVCGFCVVGWSNGAAQVSYALSHYAMEDRFDALFPTSGPPKASIHKGCLRTPGEEAYWYDLGGMFGIDAANGRVLGDPTGPCVTHDPAWEPAWRAQGIATGGSDYVHPRTRVHFLFGALDPGEGPVHGRDYAARLGDAGQPLLQVVTVPGTPHGLMETRQGARALAEAVLWAP
jgi:hypothetical protein